MEIYLLHTKGTSFIQHPSEYIKGKELMHMDRNNESASEIRHPDLVEMDFKSQDGRVNKLLLPLLSCLVWSKGGPVYGDGVFPDPRLQSNLSSASFFQSQNPFSKLQFARMKISNFS